MVRRYKCLAAGWIEDAGLGIAPVGGHDIDLGGSGSGTGDSVKRLLRLS